MNTRRSGSSRRPGIRSRVTIVATVIVAATLAASGVILGFLLHQSLISGLDAGQRVLAQSVASQAASGSVPRTIPENSEKGAVVQVLSATGKVIASTGNIDGEPPLLKTPPNTRAPLALTQSTSPLGNGSLRLQAWPATVANGHGWVYVATSLNQVDAAIGSLVTLFGVGLPIVLAIVGLIVWESVAVTLAPVERMRQRAAVIGAHDLGQRIPVPRSRDEIARLASTMNGMLDRLEAATLRQRQFVGDASHELKSPLAAVRAEIDVATAHPDQTDQRAVFASLGEQTDRMAALIDDLLFLARSDELAPTSEADVVDLDELVLAEIRRHRGTPRTPIELRTVQAARVVGSRRDLTRALRNLVENAREYARSIVLLSLTVSETTATLTVSDDGPGIAAEDRERVFERFTRLENSRLRRNSAAGFGLGLAIARQIVHAHGGTLTIDAPTDGTTGAVFLLRLPLARPAIRPVP